MSMGLYELKNELISELRVESSRTDGDFERISSPLGEQMMLPIYNEAQGAIIKSQKRWVGLVREFSEYPS